MSQIYNDYKSWQSITKQSCIGDWYINTQLRVDEVSKNRSCQTGCAITNEVWRQTKEQQIWIGSLTNTGNSTKHKQ